MKRWLVAVLAMILLLSVCGCSDAGSKTQITRKTGTTAATYDEMELPWDMDENRGHYVDNDAYPEMNDEEPTAAVAEAYFTQNGYLCVKLLIGNGTEQPLSIDELDVTVHDSVSDEMFAGSVSYLGGSLVVAAEDVTEYALHIPPQSVYAEEMASIPEEMFFEIMMDFSVAEVSDEWGMDASRGHYVDEGATPEMSGEGPMAAVQESYFTNNGHLCVVLLIGNGTDTVVSVDAIELSAYDYSTGEYLGGGETVPVEPLTVALADVEEFSCYIAPEDLTVAEDATVLELMSFDISISYTPIELE